MPRFGAQHDITVDRVISQSSHDYRRAEVKLRIRYGFDAWPNDLVPVHKQQTADIIE